MRFLRCPKCGNIVEQKLNMATLTYKDSVCKNCKTEMYEISREDVWAFRMLKEKI